MASRTCASARSTTGHAEKFMVAAGESEAGGCTLLCGFGVFASSSVCILMLFYALVGALLSCVSNGEGVLKGAWFSVSPSVIGGYYF